MLSRLRISFLTVVVLACAVTLGAPCSVVAAIIASDSFQTDTSDSADYTVGNLIPQNPTAGLSGFTGAWGSTNSVVTSRLVAEAGGLTGSLVPGATQLGQISNAVAGEERSSFRAFASVPASSTYYFSFLLNSSTANQAVLGIGTTAATEVGVNLVPQGVRVGTGDAAGADADTDLDDLVVWVDTTKTTLLTNYTPGTTYFVLVEITNNVGIDSITTSLFSAAATDLSAALGSVTVAGEISGDFTHLGVSNSDFASNGTNFDEFRFGTELTDVAAVPEPGTIALLGAGLVGGWLFRRRHAA